MSAKHTPGPWLAERKESKEFDRHTGAPSGEVRFAVLAENGKSVIMAVSEPFIQNAAANTRLIAAAPDMLEALENALGAFNERECSCDFEDGPDGPRGRACYFHRIEDDLKNAIAKATGVK